MRIDRHNMEEAFAAFVHGGSGVVVGAPGVGKTFLLRAFSENAGKNTMCLYLPIDKLGIENENDLESALQIKSDFIEYLHQQSKANSETGILILDAFDAARSENAQRFFLNLIRRGVSKLRGLWNVVVSVRTYDALKSQELQDIFPASFSSNVPRQYQMSGIRCRNFFIPPLSRDETQQAVESIDHLAELYAHSSDDFKELVRIPFNLWLIERVLLQKPDLAELSAVDSDIQLLGLFWKYRVTNGWLADERRVFLSRITRKMVNDRSLSLRTDEVYEVGGSDTWNSLLTSEVLVYTSDNEQRITFRHNILFDYAVSILLIEDDADRLIDFLSEDSSRPLFLRPSLSFYFTRLWHEEPDLFWRIFWRMLPSSDLHIRLFARLLAPTVVVNEARKIEELGPLVDALKKRQEGATEGVLRVLQANRLLRSARILPWALFLLEVSTQVQKEFAWEVAFATNYLLERAKKTDDDLLLTACGYLARNVLLWLWQQRLTSQEPWLENLGSVWAVPLVAKTIATAPEESEVLLVKVLDLLEETDYPIDYFFRLANVIEEVWVYSPDFVSILYKRIFGHRELSEARTQMGSPIMPLTSTRRQDFEMCRYALIGKYPQFLEANPRIATRTAIDCLNAFVIERHVLRYDEQQTTDHEREIEHFAFRGGAASYLSDGSYAWDQSFTDEPVKMADSVFSFIDKTAGSEESDELIEQLLDEFRDHAVVAFFWKRLLESGCRAPRIFASRLLELCLARPVLLGNETLQEVGAFIEAAAFSFTAEQRLKIEQTIMALPQDRKEEELEYLNRRRDRLIARFPAELLQTEAAKILVMRMQQNESLPTNEPLVSFSMGWGPSPGPSTEEMSWKRQGLNPERPENQALLSITASLGAFGSKWESNAPSEQDIKAILSQAEEAFLKIQESKADDAVKETALTRIAECATSMSRGITDSESPEYRFCRDVLLMCAGHPSPEPNPEADSNYTHAYWSPAPRIEAARGLTWLAMLSLDDELSEAIERLVSDPKPSVRFLATIDLFRLIDSSPDFFWHLADRIANTEKNGVVAGALFRTLSYVAIKHEHGTVDVLDQFFKRVFNDDCDISVVSDALPIVVGLAVARRNEWALATLNAFLQDPVKWAGPLRACTFNAVTFITPQRLEEPQRLPQIENAISWLSRAIQAAASAVKEILKTVRDRGSWDEEFQSQLRNVYGVIDELVTRLYFAAKIKGSVSVDHDETPPSHEQRRRYYYAIKPLLEQVVTFALNKEHGVMFAPTAHYFMQLLNGVLRYDPEGVLHLAAGVAESSEPSGYNLDSMATTEVVKLVEAVLADYRYDVRDGQPLQDLMSLLDIFAKTGDAQALALVWRLDEIFR